MTHRHKINQTDRCVKILKFSLKPIKGGRLLAMPQKPRVTRALDGGKQGKPMAAAFSGGAPDRAFEARAEKMARQGLGVVLRKGR